MTRMLCFIVLVVLTLVEVGPFPLTAMLLLWVVTFRPAWFYRLVQSVYGQPHASPRLSATAGKRGVHP